MLHRLPGIFAYLNPATVLYSNGLLMEKLKPLTASGSLIALSSGDRTIYRNLHIWMILPMLFMQLGIFKDYWGDFSDNAWPPFSSS